MIGYMRPFKRQMTRQERFHYNRMYCGMCRCLRYLYGITASVMVNYELVDMLLLLEAVQEEPFVSAKMSCSLTPLMWMEMCTVQNPAIAAAARIAVLAADWEVRDNLLDAPVPSWKDKLLAGFTGPKAQKALKAFTGDYDYLKPFYDSYMALERSAQQDGHTVSFSRLTEACGQLGGAAMTILTAEEHCPQAETLRQIACLWGEWVYLTDAVDDYEKDVRSGAFNPLRLPEAPKDMEAFLREKERQANLLLSLLPLHRHEALLEHLTQKSMAQVRKSVFSRSTF